MKQKDLWMLFAVGAIGYILYTGGYLPTGTGDGGTTVILESNQASLSVVCYDSFWTPETGGVASTIQVFDDGNKIAEEDSNTGTNIWDAEQGFRAGQTLSVRCFNNSDDGSYENRGDITLEAGMNTINIPIMSVGDPRVTIYNNAGNNDVTLGANDYQSIYVDIDTDSNREYYYRPVLCFRTNATNGNSVMDNINSVTISGGITVACDAYACGGYTRCVQVLQDDVGSSNPVTAAVLYLESGATNPSGTIDVHTVDGVPNSPDGTASINRADSYDSDATDDTIDVS